MPFGVRVSTQQAVPTIDRLLHVVDRTIHNECSAAGVPPLDVEPLANSLQVLTTC